MADEVSCNPDEKDVDSFTNSVVPSNSETVGPGIFDDAQGVNLGEQQASLHGAPLEDFEFSSQRGDMSALSSTTSSDPEELDQDLQQRIDALNSEKARVKMEQRKRNMKKRRAKLLQNESSAKMPKKQHDDGDDNGAAGAAGLAKA